LSILAGAALPARPQTKVDLRTQAKSVDFSSAESTKPFKSGATLPATCSQGEAFFHSGATPGQNLYICTATDTWTVQSPGTVQSILNYGAAFAAQTSVAIPGSTHGMATADLIVACYDSATPANVIEPDRVSVHPATFDVTVTFTHPQTGRCVVNGAHGGGGGGAVSSVFGRTGTVVKQAGDYSFADIAGTAGQNQLPAGIDAGKIGAGTVSNTKLGYLQNLAADVQQQLDGKSATGHAHTAGGDASGTQASLTVKGIQGRPVSDAVPAEGQVLTWDAAAGAWTPTGFLATSASRLKDLAVVRASATELTVGAECTQANPCNARMGSVTRSFTHGATLTAAGTNIGTGTALVYITAGGVLTAGYNVPAGNSVVCDGCTAQAGVSNFPLDSIPLFIWNVEWSGNPVTPAWDAQGTDQRAFLSSAKTVASGMGLVGSETGTSTTLAVDPSVVGIRAAAPATATSTCEAGSWAADAAYFYVCFQANSWRRVGITTW
jgi:hypothetical protein